MITVTMFNVIIIITATIISAFQTFVETSVHFWLLNVVILWCSLYSSPPVFVLSFFVPFSFWQFNKVPPSMSVESVQCETEIQSIIPAVFMCQCFFSLHPLLHFLCIIMSILVQYLLFKKQKPFSPSAFRHIFFPETKKERKKNGKSKQKKNYLLVLNASSFCLLPMNVYIKTGRK